MRPEEQAIFLFSLALASRQKGDTASAARWQAQATELLRQGDGGAVQLAALLSRGTAPARAEAENIAQAPQQKAVILALLAQQYPQVRTSLASLARALNVERHFPYYLVRRVTAARDLTTWSTPSSIATGKRVRPCAAAWCCWR